MNIISARVLLEKLLSEHMALRISRVVKNYNVGKKKFNVSHMFNNVAYSWK